MGGNRAHRRYGHLARKHHAHVLAPACPVQESQQHDGGRRPGAGSPESGAMGGPYRPDIHGTSRTADGSGSRFLACPRTFLGREPDLRPARADLCRADHLTNMEGLLVLKLEVERHAPSIHSTPELSFRNRFGPMIIVFRKFARRRQSCFCWLALAPPLPSSPRSFRRRASNFP